MDEPTISESGGVFSVTLKQENPLNAEKLLNFNKVLEEQGTDRFDPREEKSAAQRS